jgi:6-phosphogluconate dehydrogenase
LGTIGRNLLLNAAGHGFSAAGYDVNPAILARLQAEAGDLPVLAAPDAASFVEALRRPRAVLVLVPAGPPVENVISALLPHLEKGDLVVDGGNSHFRDTDRRAEALAKVGIGFLGLGVSGGERGARFGPSLMAGGREEDYRRVQPLFAAIAARAGGEPCAALLGPGSAGHYVKMVHNGIEYGLIQLLAEAYDLMKRGLGLGNDDLAQTFAAWNQGALNGFLVETCAVVFRHPDDLGEGRLVDAILDAAGQKGTGAWASAEALALGSPAPVIDAAVWMRSLSRLKGERVAAAQVLPGPGPWLAADQEQALAALHGALLAGMFLAYAQGLALLGAASLAYRYGLALAAATGVWRAGSIIRSRLLEEIHRAYLRDPGLANPLLDPALAARLGERLPGLRATVRSAAQAGLPAPAFSAALAYLDGYRSDWLPANLVQALRDDFGAHGYERVDRPGTFHTEWDAGPAD